MTRVFSERRNTLVNEPDKGRAWLIAVACSIISFFLFGIFRSYGILYLEIITTFQTTRAQASWPHSLCGTIFNLVGIALGIALPMLPVIICRSFQKYRAFAIGLACAGATISSFVFPPLLEFLLYSYTLRGAMLIMGGVVLHSVIFAMFLRPPVRIYSKTPECAVHNEAMVLTLSLLKKDELSVQPDERIKARKIVKPLNNSLPIAIQDETKESNELHSQDASPTVLICGTNDHNTPEKFQEPIQQLHDKNNKNTKSFVGSLRVLLSLCSNLMFILIAVTHSIFFGTMHTFFMIITDFAVDQGVPDSAAGYLIIGFSAGDTLGSILIPWVIDQFSVKRKSSIIVSMLLLGVFFALFSVASTNFTLHLLCSGCGILAGLARVLITVVVPEYLGLEDQAIAQGLLMFVVGITSLCRPVLVGYFRDNIGAYNNLFHTLGILDIVVALMWTLEPIILRQRVSITQKEVTVK
ncbi:monocarboxylate transporter 13-like isoform X2 [Limulus polyphemus]|uniref:Monocarboxylate transporter 13-like isoform X2 n=1 Tax=Limulus polyphemus TaxID=6850 RepID=A0ABM1TRS0_LIMPO|nr:monocarboxylate transporter 13-like isoform X2 [Limulus polyphemus]